jgi:hypothetical protein
VPPFLFFDDGFGGEGGRGLGVVGCLGLCFV